ncbi:XVIPCD domain-containing protein [Xanthomonas bromi]|uniref:XVIPCD domain-containing protein n=1 Tax=Xanthomonas bromi TaxID=56449 RepID=UPI001FD865B0
MNKEIRNPLPEHRSVQQHMLSEERHAPSLKDPTHPGYQLFAQAQGHVQALDREHGRQTDARSHNLASCLAVQSCKMGMKRIDEVCLSNDASRAFAVQNDSNSSGSHDQLRANVETVAALNTPLEQSSQAWTQAAAERRQAKQQRNLQQEQTQAPAARAMS